MSGRERSGPAAARADLFAGAALGDLPVRRDGGVRASPRSRTWPGPAAPSRSSCRPTSTTDGWPWSRTYRTWWPARWRRSAPTRRGGALALAGPGLRDVTRIAAGDPGLWTEILAANAIPVREMLLAVAAPAWRGGRRAGRRRRGRGRRGQVADRPARGRPRGRGAGFPASRAGPRRITRWCRWSSATSRASWPGCSPPPGPPGTNIEDVRIEHSPGLPVGVAELSVRPEAAEPLSAALAAGGWPVASPA